MGNYRGIREGKTMRTIVITKNLFSYDELSESAKMNVRQWLAEGSESYYYELVESIKAILNATGLKSGREWSDISNTCDYLEGVRAYKYIYNNFIYPNRKAKYLKWSDKKGRGMYSRLQSGYDCNFTGVCYDYILWDAWKDFKAYIRNGEQTSIDDFCYILSGKIKDEFENIEKWVYSDEYARETCEANNYEFDENGEVV
jgi:hypothetical protein